MLEDFTRERSDEVAEHLLVESHPGFICRVQDLLPIRAIDLLLRGFGGAIDVAHKTCPADGRKDLELPEAIVGSGKLFGHGVTKRRWKHSGGGFRRRHCGCVCLEASSNYHESCLGSVEPPVGGRTFVYIGEKEASHVAYN